MQPLAHYALLGSVLAGLAGAAILALVTIQHGLKNRARADGDDESAELSSHRTRSARVADTLAVLCFAVAASLGVLGLTQQSRAVGSSTDSALAERMQRLENRLAGTESELHTRSDLKAWEERLARLESRLGAIEEHAAVADRRLGAAEERVAVADRRLGAAEERAAANRRLHAAERRARDPGDERGRDPLMLSPNLAPTSRVPPAPASAAAKPAPIPPPAPIAPMVAPPRSAPTAPERPDASRPEAMQAPTPSAPPPRAAVAPAPKSDAPKLDAPGHATTAQAMPAPRREPARAQRASAQKPTEPSLGDKLRQDWDAIKRDASRGGDDWRGAWEQLRRLFAP